MANQWFRMYSEFAHDPKVQMMSEAMQRRFVTLLCLCCSNNNATLHDDEIAFQMRISEEEWKATKSMFISRNMLSESNKIINWSKRQFCSDSSTERSRKHREQKKAMRQQCTVAAPPPDTDTETDKNTVGSEAETNRECDSEFPDEPENTGEQEPEVETSVKRNDYPEDFSTFFRSWPQTNGSKKKAFQSWKKARDKPSLEKLLSIVDRLKKSDKWQRGIIPHPETWLNGKRWETAEDIQPAGTKPAAEDFTPKEFDPKTLYGDDFDARKFYASA